MKTYVIGTMMISLLAAGAFGQSEVNARRENQQDRIANGVKSGQLTARETANLEKKESKINKEVRADRKQNGGNLTDNEKREVNRQQNKVSGQIHADKTHADKTNAATQKYGANEVDARRANQQNRIANGIGSGKLNAGETARLERKEAGLNHQVAADRKANGGNLTNNQKRQINGQQNNVSGQIYKDKTN